MAQPIVSPKPGNEAHMKQLEEARKQPTAKEECFETLKSIGRVALGAIICSIAIVLFPISIPRIGWVVHKQNVAEKVRSAAQQALPTGVAPRPETQKQEKNGDSLYPTNTPAQQQLPIAVAPRPAFEPFKAP